MSDETKNMIDAATNQDGAAFKAAFDTAINNRVGENLQMQRQDIAQNIFGNIRVPTNEAFEFQGGVRGEFGTPDEKGKRFVRKFDTPKLAREATRQLKDHGFSKIDKGADWKVSVSARDKALIVVVTSSTKSARNLAKSLESNVKPLFLRQ